MAQNTSEERQPLLSVLFKQMMGTEMRALLGTLILFLTVVLFGWAAINEPDRLGTFLNQYNGRSIERGAVLFKENCASCHGEDGRGVPGRGPGLAYESFHDGTRLAEVEWTGSQYNFIFQTVSAGRPVVHPSYAEAMPTWSNEYGGPMRPDQVRDVVAFVQNFGLDPVPDSEAVMPVALGDGYEPPEPAGPEEILNDAAAIAELEGDIARGEALFLGDEGNLGCASCHSLDGSTLVGPSILGVDERFPYEDYTLPDEVAEADYDELHYYLVESIWYSGQYQPSGFDNLMPANFKEIMEPQDLADIVAWILQFNAEN